VNVVDSKGGLSLGTAQNVEISECNIDTKSYGIRLDAVLDTSATLTDNTVNAYIPVSVRKARTKANQATPKGRPFQTCRRLHQEAKEP
jgi:hypothetical protein